MNRITCLDRDPVHTRGDRNSAQAAGKGLFIDVRMNQNPAAQKRPIGTENLPTVGIMVPAFIGVTKGDRHCPVVSVLTRRCIDDLNLSSEDLPRGG